MKIQCKQKNISELCLIERAKPGREYKSGSCFVKLSAVDEFVGQLQTAGEIDSGYAVFEPTGDLNAEYLYIAICRKFPEFLRRYRTTINLQADALKHFVLDWHEDRETQREIVKMCNAIQREIDIIERQIAVEKEMKRWYLSEMMV